ncbi:MAG TPA: TonB family protein [Gemmatimonadales bacterium]|nr:TonB family protein [Gemmatimonadales bacterium]
MRRLLRTVALPFVAVAGLLTRSAAAQAQQRAACEFDTAAHIRWDSIDIGLAAGWDRSGKKHSPDDYLAAAQVIRAHFRAPERVRLPLWARVTAKSDTLPDESEWIGHGLDTEVQFWLSDSGRLSTERIELDGASPELVMSLVAAIRRADSAGEFLPPSPAVRRARGAIQLRLVDAPHTIPPSVTLLRIRIPVLVIDSAPSFLWMPPVEYPQAARRVQLGDRVMVELVVGANGRPDTTTIKVLYAAYRDFAVEAVRGVKEAHFRPARVAGCPVPVVVRMPIDFHIRQ